MVGDTPNLAARLQALAEPGSVVVAEATQGWSPDCSQRPILANASSKALRLQCACWRIIGETAAESRFEARHAVLDAFGRPAERTRLPGRALASRNIGRRPGRPALRRGGHRQVPPVGSTCRAARAEPHADTALFLLAPSHEQRTPSPHRAIWKGQRDSSATTTRTRRFDKLEALLSRIGAEHGETLPLLATLLSIDATGRYRPPKLPAPALRARTLAALTRLVEAPANKHSSACARRGRPLDRPDDGGMAGNAR